jgi:hypothetical protein
VPLADLLGQVAGCFPRETRQCCGQMVSGLLKNDAWLHNRYAAINPRTLLRHGLTRSRGAWVLA